MVKIIAHKKVGVVAFQHEGDLVVLADGAMISDSAWEAAKKLDALKAHLAKGRVSAEPAGDDPEPEDAHA